MSETTTTPMPMPMEVEVEVETNKTQNQKQIEFKLKDGESLMIPLKTVLGVPLGGTVFRAGIVSCRMMLNVETEEHYAEVMNSEDSIKTIEFDDVTVPTMRKILDYLEYHLDHDEPDLIMPLVSTDYNVVCKHYPFDKQYVRGMLQNPKDQGEFYDVVLATKQLDIPKLLRLCASALACQIKNLGTPEEIRKAYSNLTPEEMEQEENKWNDEKQEAAQKANEWILDVQPETYKPDWALAEEAAEAAAAEAAAKKEQDATKRARQGGGGAGADVAAAN